MSNYVTPSYWADGYTVTVTPNDDSTANEPYAPNAQGLTGVLIDLKDTIAAKIPYSVSGFIAVCFENVLAGQALYARESDGQVGLAIANDTFDKANVIGFAQTSKLSGQLVRVLIVGVMAGSGYDAGDIYYLSAASAGAITPTPPSTAGQYVVRVGEAASASELAIQLEPPIQLK